ncbi:hypothetical protein PENNAL_c0089G11954 [Penicillium nalgiovense]|uniref:Uncharacterized protein n=1 Tax=Penicillium nalgiovense TaxID=60175 RepID=A0A1V6XDW5_PENNA|nr:hypothetical protein PENNAL_c0089G11954 [Penicillium nalgiovense]
MGKKLFFSEKEEIAGDKRCRQLAESGYVFGAHAEDDSIREKDKRIPKTKKMYCGAVKLWMKFVGQYGIEGYNPGPGCAIPDHTLIKEFLRWYSHTARGKKSKNGRPVMTSVLNCAERLFGGLEEELQIKIVLEDRKEISSWIKRTLSESEGTVENVEDPNLSFTKKDFLRIISSMWQADHRRFIPGLLKAIIMLALQLYLFTGARIGAFIPAHEDKNERGLRYEHIDLVLFPSSTAPWKLEWRVNQVWLKGNRNEDYTVFGIGIRDTKRPQFASGYILLAIALQHGALFGIETVEDFAKFDLSSGKPVELRWKDEYLKKPVLRNVTADGPQDVPLDKVRFCELLRGLVATAGYSKSVTVHMIRKYLGSVIEGELPAEIKASILQTPELVEKRRQIKQLEESSDDKELLAAEKLNYRKALIRLRLAELKQYQNCWVRERRDQRILNRGKEEPVISDNNVSTRAQSLLMPEIARISTLMSSDRELSFNEMLLFVDDLKAHCERDFGVAYLPRESPIQGRCPARGCLEEIKQSAHIHNCIRREIALDLEVSESQLRFCYECMEWLKSSQWRAHCFSHLQSWESQHCEVIVYRHTVIRPGYCPFCLWDVKLDLEPEDRLNQWSKSGNLKQHIEEKHMLGDQGSGAKTICGCGQAFADERGLRYHLHDTHKLNKAIWLNPKLPRKRKRTCKAEAQVSSMEPEERPKRLRFYRYPLPRHEQWSDHIFMPVPALLSYAEEHPEHYYGSGLSDTSSECNRSSSAVSCFSAADSSFSSPPTTPGLDVIDPRILKPISLDMPYEQAPIQLDSSDLSMDELETKNELFICSKLAKRSNEDCAGDEVDERPSKALRTDSFIPPSNQRLKRRREEHHHTQAAPENKTPYDDEAGFPLTIVKTRSKPLNHPGDLSTRKPRQKLNTKEKRKLLEFKGQKLTLRQIGSQFADIDTAFLRQTWQDLELPQRCTRSGANRTARRD